MKIFQRAFLAFCICLGFPAVAPADPKCFPGTSIQGNCPNCYCAPSGKPKPVAAPAPQAKPQAAPEARTRPQPNPQREARPAPQSKPKPQAERTAAEPRTYVRFDPILVPKADDIFLILDEGVIRVVLGDRNLREFYRQRGIRWPYPEPGPPASTAVGEIAPITAPEVAAARCGWTVEQLKGGVEFSQSEGEVLIWRGTNSASVQHFENPDVIPKPEKAYRTADGKLTLEKTKNGEVMMKDFKTARLGSNEELVKDASGKMIPKNGLCVDEAGNPIKIDNKFVHADHDLIGRYRNGKAVLADRGGLSGDQLLKPLNQALDKYAKLNKEFVQHGAQDWFRELKYASEPRK